jgi:pyruvyltransferase
VKNKRRVGGVDVRYWNPRLHTVARFLNYGPHRNNFGDVLGPVIVERILAKRVGEPRRMRRRNLLAVGSILHFARNNDVVWGTGRNGKISDHWHRFRNLDVRAVRGPLTAEFLQSKDIEVPTVYGDPALLVPLLFPELKGRPKTRAVSVVPNLHDIAIVPDKLQQLVVLPTASWRECLFAIAESAYVVSSSLHGIVIADALGIPSRLVRSPGEVNSYKYDDYFLGTGRSPEEAASSFSVALNEGPVSADLYDSWSPERLLAAFPSDLWRS